MKQSGTPSQEIPSQETQSMHRIVLDDVLLGIQDVDAVFEDKAPSLGAVFETLALFSSPCPVCGRMQRKKLAFLQKHPAWQCICGHHFLITLVGFESF